MKFFHTADVHLGCQPDQGFPWSEDRGGEIWNSFRRLIWQVGREHAGLLLIAGDLFHRQPLVRELKEVNALFASIPETEVVLIAGNHDYIKPNCAYKKFPWEKNVHWLWEGTPQTIEFPAMGVSVTGFSYDRREITEPLCDSLQAKGKQPAEILLLHGGDEKHLPISRELGRKLLREGFSYLALGHIHRPEMILENQMAYAGALEPIDKNDLGAHGYVRGEIRDGQATAAFVPFAKREYRELILECRENTTQYGLEQAVRRAIKEQGEENIFCITLKGKREPGLEFLTERLYSLGNIREIEDNTLPAYSEKQLREQYAGTLLERFLDSFPGEGRSEEEEKALHYGLEALLEAEEGMV